MTAVNKVKNLRILPSKISVNSRGSTLWTIGFENVEAILPFRVLNSGLRETKDGLTSQTKL